MSLQRPGLLSSQRLGFLPSVRALGRKASNCRGPIKMAMVPRRRLELPRPNGHWHLKPARLPIPPPGLAIDLEEYRSLSDGVRIATNDGVSNLFNDLMARKCDFHSRCQMPVTIYFIGNWHWWDCKAGRHALICFNECVVAIWTWAVPPANWMITPCPLAGKARVNQ